MLHRLKKYLGYVRALGLRGGVRALVQLKLRPGQMVAVAVPGLAAPVQVRAGSSDVLVFNQVFIREEYALPAGLEAPEVIVDAGANTGYAALFFARAYPGATIVAVEPERTNFEVLCANATPYPKIVPVEAALWRSGARLEIANPSGDKWSFEVREAPDGPVQGITLEGLLERAGRPRAAVDLLKVDIEGSELELFASAGAGGWLGRTRAIIVELHDEKRPGCSDAFYGALERDGGRWTESRCGDHLTVVGEMPGAGRAGDPGADPR